MLLAAALVPILTAFSRIQPEAAYGAVSSANPALSSANPGNAVDDIVLSQGGYIVKMNASTADAPARREIFYYALKPGDTVANVAGQFGLTVDTLRWANHIQDLTTVHAGQRLLIPPVNGVLVQVQPGMTVQALAAQYHVDAQAVIDFNLLRDPDHLVVGSMLMMPDGVGPALPQPVTRSMKVWSRLGPQQTVIYYGTVGGSGGHFPYGYCTWWVAHKRYIPWSGNAWEWWYNARLYGFAEGQVPKVGAIMVQGISAWSPVGHVAYVESVNANGSFTVSEMNYGRWGVVDFRTIQSTVGLDLLGFIY